MTFGQARYARINARWNRAFEQQSPPLIMVHRGTHAGLLIENTANAVRAAIASGAEVVEIDVAQSLDGVLYCIHDGYELPLMASSTTYAG